MEKSKFGSLEDLRFGLLRHCEERSDEAIQMNYGLPRFAHNDMTSPLPNEGHKFEQAKNEPCETACRMAEGATVREV